MKLKNLIELLQGIKNESTEDIEVLISMDGKISTIETILDGSDTFGTICLCNEETLFGK